MTFFYISGVHFASCETEEFLERAFEVMDVIKKEVVLNPNKQVIIRSTLPMHTFSTIPLSTLPQFYSDLSPEHSCKLKTLQNHHTNFYMEQISKLYGFKFLNSAPIYKDRGDLHFPERQRSDCIHWCYSPETYIPEIVLLNQLLL